MKPLKIYRYLFIVIGAIFLGACHKDLDRFPTNDLTAEKVFKDLGGYTNTLAKLYVSFAVTGTNGRDIPQEIVSDEGNTGFLRQLWYLQCLTTDEAIWTWSGNTDPVGVQEMTWNASTQAVAGLYFRCYYIITQANNFIMESSDGKISERGFSGAAAETIKQYRAEARFLRAYSYSVLLDNFGAVPFTDETYVVGSGVSPKQLSKQELFSYIENELTAIEGELADPKTNELGRADKAAAWALLSRLYLNANVYTGTPKYSESIAAANKVINAGYSLHNDYTQLMLADNHTLTNEFIWTIRFDGTGTQSFSGTSFLVHAPSGITGEASGTNGSWNCSRITEDFVNKFTGTDVRGQFWTTGQTKAVTTLLGDPTAGYSSKKFRNLTRDGKPGPNTNANGDFVDVDFPVFRLAEIYLNYAEAVWRGGTGGDNSTALGYLRALAVRGRPGDAAASSAPALTENYLIDERGRELFWECQRRTDLIRFGMFTTSKYLWDWKGNVRNGTAVDNKYNIFPIPDVDRTSNPSIVQNTGY
ncbi:RagB/SusD family nutrient uptake outer membrane protein [Niabella yanshanensis]|uniref:RagB/SusD family nutrient uptake outer membrane protein n=1 Tax=Niabella yanshanensis TaxID=577386 RepID=A0ABZ0WBL5_9BACT|nr:RagB/SusD family nutrient uptake outer membrane protein [Niabella yanshanensis]WQD40576.1 RagB/SusD family nutrient uptake outer membrane protein [Niabella yanshanensis]